MQDDAFAAKNMPDLGHEVKDFKVSTWRINNWSKLDKKLTSPEFECGGHKWCVYHSHPSPLCAAMLTMIIRRILLFPFGNSNAPPNDTVSVYLDYANPKGATEGWHACAQFALVISNIHEPTVATVSRTYAPGSLFYMGLGSAAPDAHHRFIAEECDWGFTRFSELRKLCNVQEGHSRPTIENDSADISVFVRVLEDPTGVLWHNFVK
jgi:ubiquitin carboxyl-terminal hydrolase 7